MKNKQKAAVLVLSALVTAGIWEPISPVKAFEDNTAPTVLSFTISPTEVNTSESD